MMRRYQKKTKFNSESIRKRLVSRRSFLSQTIVTVAGINTLGLYSCTGGSEEKTLSVIAYNVLKCKGWPGDKVKEKERIPTLFATELAQYSPDIINFSESPDDSVVKEIAEKLGMDYVMFPGAGNWPGALLTRFTILDSENVPIVSGVRPDALFTRHWGKATIQSPGGNLISVHSVHLYPHDNPESGKIRQQEISEIIKAIQLDIENDRSVLVLGDLNHTPEMPEYKQWINAGLVDTFAEVGEGEGLTIRADKPSRRIDYVLAQGPISKKVVESKVLFEGAFRTDPADPESYALSDHLPQLATFRLTD